MKILYLLLILVLVGCTKVIEKEVIKEVPVEVEVEVVRNVTVEKIIYRNVTLPCNNTCNVTYTTYITETNNSYVLGLIRQIKRCENRNKQYSNFSYTICMDALKECNESLEAIKEAIK